jgi:hypothetical protein
MLPMLPMLPTKIGYGKLGSMDAGDKIRAIGQRAVNPRSHQW